MPTWLVVILTILIFIIALPGLLIILMMMFGTKAPATTTTSTAAPKTFRSNFTAIHAPMKIRRFEGVDTGDTAPPLLYRDTTQTAFGVLLRPVSDTWWVNSSAPTMPPTKQNKKQATA